MTANKKASYELKKTSEYNVKHKYNWQHKYACTLLDNWKKVPSAFGMKTKYNDLWEGMLSTEDRDNLLVDDAYKEVYSVRTSAKYAKLYQDRSGLLHDVQRTLPEVSASRAAVIVNLLGKTLTRNGTALALHGLDDKIIQDKKIIEDLAGEIQKMNAYHQCSDVTFSNILRTGYVKSKNKLGFTAGGLKAKDDKRAGTDETVFSIVGGNIFAIRQYALQNNTAKKGCIIEIPQRCVSNVSPYAMLLDANELAIPKGIKELEKSDATSKYAVAGPNSNFDLEGLNLGDGKGVKTLSGLIAFADSPWITTEWACTVGGKKYCTKDQGTDNLNDKYEGEWQTSSDLRRQVSQLLRSRKLDLNVKECATAFAIYMYCQYVILNNGVRPASAQDVLEASYQQVGSHACMEGHSPGELPLGPGGIERVLMIGYTDSDFIVKNARKARLKVKCISAAPETRDDFIKAFAACRGNSRSR